MKVRGNKMAKSAKRRINDAVTTAADRSSKSVPSQSAHVTDKDSARPAYDLYLARDCEHGHDVDDWLQARRDLREAVSSREA